MTVGTLVIRMRKKSEIPYKKGINNSYGEQRLKENFTDSTFLQVVPLRFLRVLDNVYPSTIGRLDGVDGENQIY